MPRMSASIHVVFYLIFLIILHSMLPTARAGSPTKAQPCVPLISTMHGQPFLIPFITWNVK